MEDATTTIIRTVIEGIPRDELVIVPEAAAAAAAIWVHHPVVRGINLNLQKLQIDKIIQGSTEIHSWAPTDTNGINCFNSIGQWRDGWKFPDPHYLICGGFSAILLGLVSTIGQSSIEEEISIRLSNYINDGGR